MFPSLTRTLRCAAGPRVLVPQIGDAPRRSFVIVINQAEIAFREFLGSNRVRLGPGIALNLPVLHSLKRIDMRESQIRVPQIHAFTADNVPVLASGTLFFRVDDAERAAYNVDNYVEAAGKVGEAGFRAVIGKYEYDFVTANRGELNDRLMEVVGSSMQAWGVQCTRFELQEFGPQNQQVARQLERQMEAERNRRETALNAQSLIKTAEGEKTAAILKSEGLLQAAKNEADAERYQLVTKANALRTQIEALSACFEVGPGGSKMGAAARFLLDLERLGHLQRLAASPNKVYFLPDAREDAGLAARALLRNDDLATSAATAGAGAGTAAAQAEAMSLLGTLSPSASAAIFGQQAATSNASTTSPSSSSSSGPSHGHGGHSINY